MRKTLFVSFLAFLAFVLGAAPERNVAIREWDVGLDHNVLDWRCVTEEPPPGSVPEEPLVPGLDSPSARALERFPIRTRESSVTRAAWRLSVTSAEGEGAIVLLELSSGQTLYRGEGVFLGWPQERLEPAYHALLPRSDEPNFEIGQLG